MKKFLQTIIILLFALLAFVSVCWIIDAGTDVRFVLSSNLVYAIVIMAMSVAAAVLSCTVKTPVNKAVAGLACFTLPLAIINGCYYVLNDSWQVSGLFTLVCGVCMIIVLAAKAKPLVLKIVTGIISVIPCLLFLVLFFANVLFGDFSYNTVEKSVNSPNNTYIAEVVSSDQGALGGDTYVKVKSNKEINLLIAKFSDEDKTVYSGSLSAAEGMEISWKDENTLIVNGTEYYIDD